MKPTSFPAIVTSFVFATLTLALLSACSGEDGAQTAEEPRRVIVQPARAAEGAVGRMSGIVRARYETPLGFQVAGRIAERRVDAGSRVAAGDILFRLDPEELEQAVAVAEADLQAARAELETARAETRRNRDLLEREFISPQVFERVQLAEQSAREQVDAAAARLRQSRIRLGYADLAAVADGTLIDVAGEPGQVVSAGQAVAVLAHAGRREIEVFLPERLGVPESGWIVNGGDRIAALELREAAGAADAVTRTWRARYAVTDPGPSLRLGSVVRVELALAAGPDEVLEVPVGAINERGAGPRVWVIVDGRAQPRDVTLLDMDTDYARIVGPVAAGEPVIAVGTHLLEPGLPVRPLAP